MEEKIRLKIIIEQLQKLKEKNHQKYVSIQREIEEIYFDEKFEDYK